MSLPEPEELAAAVDQALTDALGFHGQWVLGVECMEPDSGELTAAVVWSHEGTAWARLGLAHMLVSDLTDGIQTREDDQ